MRKISIVANKNWEVEPVLAAVCSSQFRPATLPFPIKLLTVKDNLYRVNPELAINDDQNARAIIEFHENNDPKQPVAVRVSVWCIQDFMSLKVSSSSSQEKQRFLPALLNAEDPDLVVCVGTAGYISENAVAGCVTAGARFFVHNAHPNNPQSQMESDRFDQLLPLTVSPDFFNGIFNPGFKAVTEPKFLKTPVNPASRAAFIPSQYNTALSSVNVVDYSEYDWVDNETVAAFRKVETRFPVGSLETTHGVIRLCSEKPMLYISAITDKEGDFAIEVTAGQNYVAAFNAGIVVGQFINDLYFNYLSKTADFDFQYHPAAV